MDIVSESENSIDDKMESFLIKHGVVDAKQAKVDDLKEYLPAYERIHQLLSTLGYSVTEITQDDIDVTTRSVSTLLIDTIFDSIFSALSEISGKLRSHEAQVQDVILTEMSEHSSNRVALESHVQSLQAKLFDAETKIKSLENEKHAIEKDKIILSRKIKENEVDLKRSSKSFEQQIQESERRVRQRDLEIDRYRTKLQQLNAKEKQSDSKHKNSLQMLKRGEIDLTSSRHHKSPSVSDSSASGVIEALEHQRDQAERRNMELRSQVRALEESVKELSNTTTTKGSRQPIKATTGLDQLSSDSEDREVQEEHHQQQQSAQSMFAKITAQKRRIEQLEHRCEQYLREREETDDIIRQMRGRAVEMREEIENLRLELGNRPTMRQWTQKQREVADMEDKLHDLVMMRGEAAEIASWRKHLSTGDRIKADKRNYELGLLLLDSLPKTVMKEVLQAACRELDISEISELQPTIVKLKAVVKIVPRMEAFCTAVCSYIFQRDSLLQAHFDGADRRPTMDDVLPALKRWWKAVQRCEQLEGFQDKVFQELHRREIILGKAQRAVTQRSARGILRAFGGPASGPGSGPEEREGGRMAASEDSDPQDYASAWELGGRLLWAERDWSQTVELIRDMCNFQCEVLKHNQSFQAAETFIRARPEELTGRLLRHLQYLFEIPSLDALLPRMNSVYIFTEQMRNFLSVIRELLGIKRGAINDQGLIAEIESIVAKAASKG